MLTSPRPASAAPSVPQRPDMQPFRAAVAALVKMAKKKTKKKKTPPRNGEIDFFFAFFFAAFTTAAITALPAAHRAAAARLVPRWPGAPTSVSYMSLPKLKQIDQNIIQFLNLKILVDFNLELLIAVLNV